MKGSYYTAVNYAAQAGSDADKIAVTGTCDLAGSGKVNVKDYGTVDTTRWFTVLTSGTLAGNPPSIFGVDQPWTDRANGNNVQVRKTQ
jgi:hypothetical protein